MTRMEGESKATSAGTVAQDSRLSAALKAHRHLRGDLVFSHEDGSPLTQSTVEAALRYACKRAGLRSIGSHVLRHTFCSHRAMRGCVGTARASEYGRGRDSEIPPFGSDFISRWRFESRPTCGDCLATRDDSAREYSAERAGFESSGRRWRSAGRKDPGDRAARVARAERARGSARFRHRTSARGTARSARIPASAAVEGELSSTEGRQASGREQLGAWCGDEQHRLLASQIASGVPARRMARRDGALGDRRQRTM